MLRLTDEAHLRDLIHPLTRGQIAHYHDLSLRLRVLSVPVLVCVPAWPTLGRERGPGARPARLPDLLAAVPAAALLLFDRGVINCGPFAQLTLARITVVTRARSTLAWQIMRTVHRTSHTGDAVVWSGRGTDRV